MRLDAILESSLYVDNLQAALSFYIEVLGLELHSYDPERHIFLKCGEQMLLLFLAERTARADSALPRHGSHGQGHLAFAVSQNEFEVSRRHLERHGVPIEQEVTWPNGGRSFYFRDPSGNSLEIATRDIWHSSS